MEKSHPNLLGLAVLCGLIGGIIAVLGVRAYVTAGVMPDAIDATSAVVLIGLAVVAFRAHRRLASLTPEQRDIWWRAIDERYRENHERNVETYVRRGKDGIG